MTAGTIVSNIIKANWINKKDEKNKKDNLRNITHMEDWNKYYNLYKKFKAIK